MKDEYKKLLVSLLILLMTLSTLAVFSSNQIATVKAQTTIPSNLLQYEWTQNAQDSSRSSFNPGPGPTTPHIEWRTELPLIRPFLTAFNGMVFVEDSPPAGGVPSVYALDATTGKVVYKNVGASGDVAKLDNTYMLIGSNCYKISDGSLVWKGPSGFSQSQTPQSGLGYNAELKMIISGSQAWSLANPAQPPTLSWNRAPESDYGAYGGESAVIYGDGVVVYNTVYNYVRGVDARTGKTLWTTPTTVSDWVYGSSVINGVFGRGDLSGNFYGWNITTGKLMWIYNPGTYYNEWASATAAAYGMFYEKNQDTNVYAINATTGKLVWSYKGPGVAYSNTLTIAGGKVYAMTGDNQYVDFSTGKPGHSEFACLDAFTGQVIWTEPWENGPPFNSQCNAYGKLFIAPTVSSYNPGVYTYSFTQGVLSEVWCIGDAPKDWSMFLGDPANSGFGDGPTNLALKWNVTTGGVVSSPALVDGVAYVGSWDGNIYAFNANTGAQIWNYATGRIGFSSTPAVINGKLYTGADDGNVYCLDATTGTKLWAANAGGIPTSPPSLVSPLGAGSPTVVDDRVYVAAGNTLLYCFNALNGAIIWTYNATQDIHTMKPTVVDGAVYFGANGIFMREAGPHVIKLNATTGAQIFNVVIPGYFGGYSYFPNIYASVTVGAGMAFARGIYRYNYALNATTGAIVWMVDGKYNPGSPFQAQGNGQYAPMLYEYGIVYFPDYYGITAVNALNGTELWSTYLSRENAGPGISYSYGRIYTVTEAGALYVLDASSGAKLSFYQLGHTTLKSVPTPYNGSLYLGSRDWNLYCFQEAPPQQFHGALSTSTTVSVALKFQTRGLEVLFEGTVAAQSNGTQTGIPVQVHLTAIDPNNNFQDVGNVTCDDSGFYSTTWVPPVSGKYVSTASFEGDQFFLPSSAKTAFIVTKAAANPVVTPTQPPSETPPPTVTTTPSPSPLVTTTPVPPPSSAGFPTTYIVIAVVAIIVVVAAAAVVLRRRK